MSIDLNWYALAPYLLIAGGLAMALGGGGLKQVASAVVSKAKTAKRPQQASSDAEAPDGFKEHVAVVLDACPNAPYETRLVYLIDGLTEAQTLRREVERLNANTTLNEPEP